MINWSISGRDICIFSHVQFVGLCHYFVLLFKYNSFSNKSSDGYEVRSIPQLLPGLASGLFRSDIQTKMLYTFLTECSHWSNCQRQLSCNSTEKHVTVELKFPDSSH
jgi:hypothetical protein